MHKIQTVCCLIFCLMLSVVAMSQRIISGKIHDKNHQPLPGVYIITKENKALGTVSDAQGNYVLTLPESSQKCTLQASLMGYNPEEFIVSTNEKQKKDFLLIEKEVDLDIIVVTGTRTPKLLKNSPIVTKVITSSDLKKVDATNIGELLQSELPGIEFSYSMNQQVSINMQGFGGNAVLFLIDGERIAGESMDNVDYTRLNLDNVERIEIIKGAASTLYGSSAVGGVVNIITKTKDEPWAANVNAKLGAHGEERYGGTVSFNAGKFNSMTNIQHAKEDGYKVKNPGAYDGVLGNKTWNFKERLQYTINNKMKLVGRAGYFFRERDAQVAIKDRYRGFTGGIKGNYEINDKNNLELAYAFDQYDKSDYYVLTKYDIRDYSNVQNNVRGLYNHRFNDDYLLTIGGDYMHDYLSSYQFTNNGSYSQSVADVFAQIDLKPIDKLNIITGLRYDYFSENNEQNLSTSLALMYKVGNCALRASYAKGFRAPSLKEMYMNFDMASVFMIYGNPDLKSETSHNFTLSTEYTNKNYNLSVIGYYNAVNDRITTAWSQALKGQIYTNIDDITICGIDANASVKLSNGFGAKISYIYAYENIKKGQPQVAKTRPHSATARIEYGKSWKNYGFNLMLSGRFLSAVSADEYTSVTSYDQTERVHYPAYTMWKLCLLQNIWKGIDFTMTVDNLFNYVPSYYYGSSPYTTGTTFSAGISIDIDKLFK